MFRQSTPAPVTYKPIEGFPGYRVGDDGTVWSCRFYKKLDPTRWKPVKIQRHGNGYSVACLRKTQSRSEVHRRYVHRLVLEAFVGPCPENMEACHNDGDPGNNHLSNLRWDTPKGNAADRERHGNQPYGASHHSARYSEEQVRRVYVLRDAGLSFAAIGRETGINDTSVRAILRGQAWRHLWRPTKVPERPRGEGGPSSKLTEFQVREIRIRVQAGESKTHVAQLFNVSRQAVQLIVLRKTWRHVP